jgi:hypothetical protein
MVDIGEGRGALVVYTTADLVGREIEIRAQGTVWTGTHTAVRDRELAGKVLHAGVFGSLAAGPYDLRVKAASWPASPASPVVTSVRVAAGTVTETHLVPAGARP